ncbi:uncharacterized protein PV06_11190 [Exophiala oligosperma]|uniref:Uncharacterized protein n=1 Tax=Exophiala oligosperma TaxID=215243 RepID=A0A0D2D019_9EURO|nr:uncharacterized protein PV06_11190 [Exophiala oligosperma]KIW36603.1 hypothetical protein PV06_11190 [Exophiala oligosperma]
MRDVDLSQQPPELEFLLDSLPRGGIRGRAEDSGYKPIAKGFDEVWTLGNGSALRKLERRSVRNKNHNLLGSFWPNCDCAQTCRHIISYSIAYCKATMPNSKKSRTRVFGQVCQMLSVESVERAWTRLRV